MFGKPETRDEPGYFYIKPDSRMVASSLQYVEQAIEKARKSKHIVYVFDMGDTAEIDSTAIGLLTKIYKEVTPKGGEICAINVPQRLKRTLEVTSASNFLRILKNIEAVEDEFGSPVRAEDRGFYYYLKIPETFDILVVQPLRSAIDKALGAGHKNILFDMTETQGITSVGIGVLMNLKKKLGQNEGGVFLLGVQPSVEKVIQLSNLSAMLPSFSNIEDAERDLI